MSTTRRKAKPQNEVVMPTRIATGNATGTYKPVWQPLRPNADQHEGVPSRHQGQLFYRDGRVEAV